MRTKVFILPVVGMALLFAACDPIRNKQPDAVRHVDATAVGKAKAYAADSSGMVSGLTEEEQQVTANYAGGHAPKNSPRQTAPVPNPDWDRKIVKTADLDLHVKNFQLFTSRLHASVKQSGGYIAQEQEQTMAGELENTVMIRVPVDRFEDLIAALPADSDKLVEKKISSEDVSMELVDTKSRLETKKEARERYMELLKQAHSMKDIIGLQSEIDDIQEQMDQASGRIAWLGHSAAYSTIHLHFYEVLDASVQTDRPPSFFHRLKESIGEGWKSFSSILLDMISVWPLWVVLIAGVAWFRRRQRGVRARTPVVAVPE